MKIFKSIFSCIAEIKTIIVNNVEGFKTGRRMAMEESEKDEDTKDE